MATGWETLTRSAKLHVPSRGTLNPKVKESALVAFQEDAEHPRRHPPPATHHPRARALQAEGRWDGHTTSGFSGEELHDCEVHARKRLLNGQERCPRSSHNSDCGW